MYVRAKCPTDSDGLRDQGGRASGDSRFSGRPMCLSHGALDSDHKPALLALTRRTPATTRLRILGSSSSPAPASLWGRHGGASTLPAKRHISCGTPIRGPVPMSGSLSNASLDGTVRRYLSFRPRVGTRSGRRIRMSRRRLPVPYAPLEARGGSSGGSCRRTRGVR